MKSHSEQKKEEMEIKEQLNKIKKRFIIMSGKGGVGKSTVAVNIALGLAQKDKKVGLVDVDIHGPSIPTLLNLENAKAMGTGDGKILPIEINNNLKVVSIGFFLPSKDEAVIWRGPLKMSFIKQVIKDVLWGELDYLIFDCPPGTGDEPLSVIQIIKDVDGAIIVTTPQEVAISDVRKSISFCEALGTPILGIIENMSGFICPHCGKETPLFKTGGGEKLAKEKNINFLGKIPFDPKIVESGDEGKPFILDKDIQYMNKIIDKIIELTS